jgi:hypothetical protein
VFYAELPPINVTVANNTPSWAVWAPIIISLVALLVSGLAVLLNYLERKRIMPSIRMHGVYTDSMYMGDIHNLRKVVGITLTNTGREATTVSRLDIASNEGTYFSALGMQLDDKGDRITHDDGQEESVPGFGSRHYRVDASVIQGNEVVVEAEFGHGPQIVLHLPLNELGDRKPLSGHKLNRILRSWDKAKAKAAKKANRSRRKGFDPSGAA